MLQKPMNVLTSRNSGPVHSVKLSSVFPAFIANFIIVMNLLTDLVLAYCLSYKVTDFNNLTLMISLSTLLGVGL